MTAEFSQPIPAAGPPATHLAEAQARAFREAQALAQGFDPYLQVHGLGNRSLTPANRTNLSLTTARFLHDDMDRLNNLRVNIRGEQPVPVLPEDMVEYNVRNICLTFLRAPAQRELQAEALIRPAVRQRHAYRTQVGRLLLFGNSLRHNEHPLAGCATDVLMAYGKTIAGLTQQQVIIR